MCYIALGSTRFVYTNTWEQDMIRPTEEFVAEVRTAWGDAGRVAHAGINEMYKHHKNLKLGHSEQVEFAKQIGIIAGRTALDKSPNGFIGAFTELLNKS